MDRATRLWLLDHARRSIAAHLRGAPLPEATDSPAAARAPRGCFVTLHTRAGALRGCIGLFEGPAPLHANVQEMAIAAATRDPRFAPLEESELADCTLEISALTPRIPATYDDVRIGTHGLWVTRGNHRGVLLPQVATAQGWDKETFLNQTCVKAGLPPDAWRDGSVALQTFAAEVFSEHEI